eukprot:Sspe_Gene.115974::Locus_104176_Transcript_1_1_Confidence_1.000_Length_470::g.115974::m.115974
MTEEHSYTMMPMDESDQAGSSSPSAPAAGSVTRTPEQEEALRKKLTAFYTRYNPSMLEGDLIEKIVKSSTPDSEIFKKLAIKYRQELEESSDDDYQEHPQLVKEGDEKSKLFKRKQVRPRGGDHV